LGDAIAAADEPYELPLGGLERRVGHHVEESDVQLADVLVQGAVEREQLVPLGTEVLERRQLGVRYEWHYGVSKWEGMKNRWPVGKFRDLPKTAA
jgi:hypothetical protein